MKGHKHRSEIDGTRTQVKVHFACRTSSFASWVRSFPSKTLGGRNKFGYKNFQISAVLVAVTGRCENKNVRKQGARRRARHCGWWALALLGC